MVWMANDQRYDPLRELPGYLEALPPELRGEPDPRPSDDVQGL
jgi:hypothetical protein